MAFFIILAFIEGCVSVISKMMNFKLAQKLGLANGTLVNYVTASLISIAVVLFLPNNHMLNLKFLEGVPAFFYFGGVFGLLALLLNIVVIPKIPVFYSTVLVLVGQLGLAFIVDGVMNGRFSMFKLVGIFLIIFGIWLDKIIITKEQVNNI